MRKEFLFILFMCFVLFSSAQNKSEYTQSRILILLDESSSMIQPWVGNKEKYKAAHDIILNIYDSVIAMNKNVEFSLRVFGHQHNMQENNCYDTKNEVAFSRSNRTQLDLRLSDIKPRGVTPIAYALSQAAEYDLVDEDHNAYSIILITDGGESCGGDLCEVMRKLIKNKVFFKPYIVGLEDYPELRKVYACMGNYLQVTSEGDIPGAVSTIVQSFRPILNITQSDYKILQKISASAPSILKVNTPPVEIIEEKTKPETTEVKKNILPVLSAISYLVPAQLQVSILNNRPPITLQPVVLPAIADLPIEKEPLKVTKSITYLKTASIKEPEDLVIPINKMNKVQLPQFVETLTEAPTLLPAVATINKLQPASYLWQNDIKKIEHLNTIIVPPAPTIEEIEPIKLPPSSIIAKLQPAQVKIETIAFKSEQLNIASVPPSPVIEEIAPLQLPIVTSINRLMPAHLKQLDNPTASTVPLNMFNVPLSPVIEEKEPIQLPLITSIKTLKPALLKLPDEKVKNLISLSKIKDIQIPDIDIKEMPELPVAGKMNYLKSAGYKKPLILIIEDQIKQRKVPEPPSFVPIPVVKNKPEPVVKPGVPPGIKSSYTIETEDAKETGLMVYFTNGRGKYFASMPQIMLVEPTFNRIVKKFYRTVDPNGNPDLQKDIPAGTYNLALTDKRNLVIHDVVITEGKTTKVIVKLKNCSLSFYYIGDSTRPVKEFMARVIERNNPNGVVIDQKCTQKLEYEPSSYHIIINTFPEDPRYLDMDFDSERAIGIPIPGFVKFTSAIKNRKITLYKPLGDKYLAFSTKNTADTALQHLQIQPGPYQVHYIKDPSKPHSKEEVIPFTIKSNLETEVVLP